ncbi:hypothetical protein [Paenibacillus dauci]|uniref:hypothetical protein n=1 Tax=Paenibacillus dauci TaxID=1567106 RepID=UPI0006191003|nr:hypothetical protein [Paenibacillus dauci]
MKKIITVLMVGMFSLILLAPIADAAQVEMVKSDSKIVFKESSQFQGTGKYQKFTCSIAGSGGLSGDCMVLNVSNHTIASELGVGTSSSYPNNNSIDVFLNKGQVYRLQARVDIQTNNGVTVRAAIDN